MSDAMDFYDLLGVDADAGEEEVRRAFRQRVREYHPDLNDDPRAPAQFIALKRAYDTLVDPKERDAYDRLGHETYVSERISGLPSTDAWERPDDPERSVAQESAAGVESTGRRDGESVAGDADGDEFDVDLDLDVDVDLEDGDDPGGLADGAESDGVAVGPDGLGAGEERSGSAAEFEEVASRSAEVRKSPTASGAGTARGPKTAPDPGEPSPATPTATAEYTDPEAAEESADAGERSWPGLRWLLGWPLVGLADLLYLGALAVYGSANGEGLRRLAVAVDGGGMRAALDSRHGVVGMDGVVASVHPLLAAVVALGVAALPAIYFLLVRWTRRNGRSWQPSYLYVAGAAAPVAGVVAAALRPPSGLVVDLLAYVVLPTATMGAMLFFGQVWPRSKRLVRQYLYRLLH